MRGVWYWVKGQVTFGKALYGAAQRMLSEAMSADSRRPNGADMRRYLSRMTSRYAPPRIDVGVKCFIAGEGKHFNTDPSSWRKLARKVDVVSVPGNHSSMLVAERGALAQALAAALNEAQGWDSSQARRSSVELLVPQR
jgi:thioesterase domain-containing protein